MHQYHWEAQHDIGAKDRLHKYTVPSHVTDNINKDYGDMHNEIEGMVNSLENKVRGDQEKFLIEFESALRKLHARYRELENKNAQLSSMEKFTADLDEKWREREALNSECSEIDQQIRKKQEELINLKKENEELSMEHEFLESQVNAAELNQFTLDNRHDELSENIKSLTVELEK